MFAQFFNTIQGTTTHLDLFKGQKIQGKTEQVKGCFVSSKKKKKGIRVRFWKSLFFVYTEERIVLLKPYFQLCSW